MAWITPKTNWNINDFYNYSDLNRVENNTLEMANICREKLNHNGVIPRSINIKRDYSSIEFVESLNRIESNIDSIKVPNLNYDWLPMKTNWKVGDSFSYVDAIRLEKNLETLHSVCNAYDNSILYCGEFSLFTQGGGIDGI